MQPTEGIKRVDKERAAWSSTEALVVSELPIAVIDDPKGIYVKANDGRSDFM